MAQYFKDVSDFCVLTGDGVDALIGYSRFEQV